MLNVQNADIYTDFNGLAKLKNEAKQKTPEAIKEVAKQFESIFVGMMLKSMRQAKLAEGIFDNSQSDFYRDMYDQQLSVHLAGENGIGLADMIVKQLSPDQSVNIAKEQTVADYERQILIQPRVNKTVPDAMITELEQLKNSSKAAFDSAEDFVNQLRPYAHKAAKALGVDANMLLAQAALETGWGKSVIKDKTASSYNLFNIKADKSWQGGRVKVSTLEFKQGVFKKEMAGFRAYSSYQQSFDDYVQFIKTNPRYSKAIKMAEKAERYMHELQQAGYATDPDYAKKVIKISKSNAINQKIVEKVVNNSALTSNSL